MFGDLTTRPFEQLRKAIEKKPAIPRDVVTDPTPRLHKVHKIAGLAVRRMEQHGAPMRKKE